MNNDLLDGFATCVRIRHFEERLTELKLQGVVAGSVHLCNGQEAIAAGVCASLESPDLLTCTYRGHGWAIAKGVPLRALAAELLGRSTGVNAGRAGSALLSHISSGFVGENSIVGAGAPIAVGLAMAAHFDASGGIAVSVFGDGATNQGAVHEAINFAVVKRAPVLFVCENNVYSELTPISAMIGEVSLADRARAYGLPAISIDGNDFEAVHAAAFEAAERARSGGGPTFLEAHTERLVGHYIGDVQQYRKPGEIDRARLLEPINRLKSALAEAGFTTEAVALREVREQNVVNEAIEAALEDPFSETVQLREHLYA